MKLHETDKSLEPPSLKAELWQCDMPIHVPLRLLLALRRAGRLSISTSSWAVQYVESGLSGSLNWSNKGLVMNFSF